MQQPTATVRKIIHIDMDAFFASVEQRDNPELRGKPVIVGGSPQGRGVVATCSYEARRFGIHSAMPCAEAYRRCRHAVFVPPRFDAYKEASQQIRAIFVRYTDLVEPLSLDEAYLDVTRNHLQIPSATWIAERIRQEIEATTGLTASAGVSSLKFLAKIASDMNKPNGLTVIPPEKIEATITTLPVGKIFGIGKVTEARLAGMGIRTGGDLRACPEAKLLRRFGKHGHFFYQLTCGIDDRPVRPNRERKSVSVENTYAQDLSSAAEQSDALADLADRLANRLTQKHTRGRTLLLKVRFDDFQTFTRSRSKEEAWDSQEVLLDTARTMMETLLQQYPDRSVRLLGIGISNLLRDKPEVNPVSTPNKHGQLSLPF